MKFVGESKICVCGSYSGVTSSLLLASRSMDALARVAQAVVREPKRAVERNLENVYSDGSSNGTGRRRRRLIYECARTQRLGNFSVFNGVPTVSFLAAESQ